MSPDVIATAIALFGVAAMILAGTWRMFVHHEKRTDARFAQVDARFDQVNARIDRVDGRLDRVEDRLGSVEHELTEVKISIARLEGPQPRLLVPHTR